MKYISSYQPQKSCDRDNKRLEKEKEQFGKSFLWEQVSSVTRYKRAFYREENRDSPTYKQKSKTMFLCEELQRFWTSQHVENIMSPKDERIWRNVQMQKGWISVLTACDSQTTLIKNRQFSLNHCTATAGLILQRRRLMSTRSITQQCSAFFGPMLI